ncbi:PREDICTED: zinc finger CCCH domain-containing protein 53-like isoform X2 [Nicotiana attenuata]|uniref:Zinc finger ccch domain-containing protein 53 n=1 Tax=Nicotiana attenuata TaxID=49451 RepID=A0A1J6K0P2_NICAT|nr:PREDICTED: zinc finger CCCH domain-containing protein 53-like isoform X2 [Nicotiana attenuata]OIT22236.1 zinc finger ccch domain-containing protein 53 [Nicotiana attenuata]
MDAYEATKIVYQRIQNLDPENASKIMGILLIQDHGEKEMIRLAFGPEALVHSVILKARKELGLASNSPSSTPSTPSSPSPFSGVFSRQNSSSGGRILGGINLPSPLSITSNNQSCSTVSASWSNTTPSFSDFQETDLVSPSASTNGISNSTMNSSAPPFYCSGEMDLIDEFQLQDQLSFLNDGSPTLGPKNPDVYYPQQQQQDLASSPSGDFSSYNWGSNSVNGLSHRRSCSVSDISLGGDDPNGGFGWKPCLYFARGYCKNGSSCRFLHGAGEVVSEVVGSPSKFEMMEQHCQQLLRSKSTSQQQRLTTASQLMASSNFPFSPVAANKCMNFLQQQQLQQSAESPRAAAAAALMMGDDMHKLNRIRFERGDFGLNGGAGIANPGSRQIYLTFPADSTFKEEDVSNYFSTYGPVQDVRIPYQQKRMFGFVTFVYPDTVKTILAKGNPHFVCDARVLVKPYKEKGKVPEKFRKQQQPMERGEFTGCGSPTGLDSRDPFDIQLGARMFYNSQDMILRRKLEEQADLQQAIELQSRRLMNLQLLDVKRSNHHRALSLGAVIPSPPHSPGFFNQNFVHSPNLGSREAVEENGFAPKMANFAAFSPEEKNPNLTAKERDCYTSKDENSNGKESSKKEENDFQESLEHNLPDSPFASPKAVGEFITTFSNDATVGEGDKGAGLNASSSSANNNMIPSSSLFPATSALDITPFKSCYFQVPRFPSGHGTIGM